MFPRQDSASYLVGGEGRRGGEGKGDGWGRAAVGEGEAGARSGWIADQLPKLFFFFFPAAAAAAFAAAFALNVGN